MDFITGYVLGSRMRGKASGMAASAASFGSNTGAGQLYDLNDRIDRVLLVVEAMWALLEESGYTREQLAERIAELDGSDGVQDGKATPPPVPCPKCGARMSAGAPSCQFCGYDNPEPHPMAGL